MSTRLRQIDGLRALAAGMVIAYHYTTRYDQRFGHTQEPPFSVPWGSLGVELFFVISGFVIFMTLARARQASDFVVSRLSRLFPTYWAALLLTWLVVAWADMPGLTKTVVEGLWNLTMLSGTLGVLQVDGVYWSLEVELFFYAWMLLAAATGCTRRGLGWLWAWLWLSVLAALLPRVTPWHVPYIVGHIAVLPWIGWFALGIVAWRAVDAGRLDRPGVLTGLLALAAVGAHGGAWVALFGIASACAVTLAARGRLWGFDATPLVGLGAISYPLYLIHQEAGMAVMLQLQQRGWPVAGSMLVALGLSVLVAVALHRAVEGPAMRAIRQAWRARNAARQAAVTGILPVSPSGAPSPSDAAWPWPRTAWVSMALIGAVAVGAHALQVRKNAAGLRDWNAVPLSDAAAVDGPQPGGDCPDAGSRPVVLLLLGSVNATSALPAVADGSAVTVFHNGRCVRTADPLPQTSGQGASLWTALAMRLQPTLGERPLVLVPLGLGRTTIQQWTEPGPVRQVFLARLQALRAAGLVPTAVAWQQGEADMLLGSETRTYTVSLQRLRADLDTAGIVSPLLLAQSSFCGQAGSGAINRARERILAQGLVPRTYAGADTDALGPALRSDGCHLNAAGREAAALAWAQALRPWLPGGTELAWDTAGPGASVPVER